MDLEKELKRLREERQKKFDEEDWEGALEIHDKILELSPSALRYANRGSILYRLNRLEEAIEAYKKALEMDPNLKRAKADLERLERKLEKEKGKKTSIEDLSESDKQKKLNELREERQKALDKEDWETALKIHEQIIEIEPTALRYVNKGSILYRMGKIKEAIEAYKKALEMDPSLERAKLDLARLEALLEEEKLIEAKEDTKEKDAHNKIEELRKERQKYIDAKDWEKALEIHEKILEIEPTPLRYANKGALLYRLGRLKEALESYRKALEMDPSLDKIKEDIARLEAQLEEEGLIELPEAQIAESEKVKAEKIAKLKEERQKYIDAKDWEKALEIHEKILEIEPTALRYVNKGTMLYRLKRLEEAVQSYKKALELDPNLGRARRDLERIERELFQLKEKEKEKEITQALEVPEVSLGKEPPKKELSEEEKVKLEKELKEKRNKFIKEENWEEALKVQEQLIELEPSASRYASRGSMLYRLGKINEAILSYRKALEIDPNLEMAQEALEDLKETELDRLRQERKEKMKQEDWEGALELHDIIIALEPTPLRYANRGSILYRLNRLEEAVESYKKALELDPNLEKAKEDLEELMKELEQKREMEKKEKEEVTITALSVKEFEEDEEEILQAVEIEEPEEEILQAEVAEEKEKIPTQPQEKEFYKELKEHTSEITQILPTSDEKYIITSSKDKTIKVWKTEDFKSFHNLQGHEDWVRDIAITPDNSKIISGSDDWTLRIWDLKSGRCEKTLEEHIMPVVIVAVSSNGRFIFSGSRDCTLKIWDTKSGKRLSTLKGHEDWISSFALTRTNKAISGSYDKTIKVWNILGWRCMNTLKGHEDWIKKLVITPDNKRIISMGNDNKIKIWDVLTGKCTRTLELHTNSMNDICVSPKGELLASTGKDKYLYIWNIPKGEQFNVFCGENFEKLLFINEKLLAVSTQENQVFLYNLEGNENNNDNISNILTHSSPVTAMKYLNKKNYLITGTKQGEIYIWKLKE